MATDLLFDELLEPEQLPPRLELAIEIRERKYSLPPFLQQLVDFKLEQIQMGQQREMRRVAAQTVQQHRPLSIAGSDCHQLGSNELGPNEIVLMQTRDRIVPKLRELLRFVAELEEAYGIEEQCDD